MSQKVLDAIKKRETAKAKALKPKTAPKKDADKA